MTATELMRRLRKRRRQIKWDAKSPDIEGSRALLLERLKGIDEAIAVVREALKEPEGKRPSKIKGRIDE